ncbi:Imm50 family immunity protein [Streptomyces lavendulocolor]|uniref:Imm50 family immunity protein n=1 Tax=Streptomyces lavendulocolor TaxID=67316 RepID=UPI003C2CC16F
MGDSEWLAILGSAEIMKDAYTSPPDQSECRLHYFQIDEREASVTFGFDTSRLPSKAPADWRVKGYNTVEFYVKFTGVKQLRASGWDFTVRDAEVSLTRLEDEGLSVSLASEGAHISFVAARVLIPRVRSYLAGQE